MIPPQIGHNIFTISFIKFRFFHLYTLSWNHLCFDSIERIELNRWLNAQQISPAGNSHFGSASLNIETKIKMIAATDNPMPTSSNKIFSCFIPKSPLLNPVERRQYRANGAVRSRAFFRRCPRARRCLKFLSRKTSPLAAHIPKHSSQDRRNLDSHIFYKNAVLLHPPA